jgi:hypothetical protein
MEVSIWIFGIRMYYNIEAAKNLKRLTYSSLLSLSQLGMLNFLNQQSNSADMKSTDLSIDP